MQTTANVDSQFTTSLSIRAREDLAPQTSVSIEDFWVRYSNLLVAVWSNPELKAQLSVTPVEILSAFDLPVPRDARVKIETDVDMESPRYANQHEEWTSSAIAPGPRTYTLYIPNKPPGGMTYQDYNAPDTLQAGSNCCCSCCPCCSCF